MADTEGESSNSSSSTKPLIVRVKRKSSQSPLEALWLEINERPLKRPLVDFDKLSITTDSTITEIVERKKVLVQHVETVASSKASIQVLQSIVVPNSDDAVDFKTKVEERRQTFKQENKTDKLLLRAREKHEDMAKNARFEQIWKKRKGKGIHEMCSIYDVVRVDEEELIPKKLEQQTEDMSLEDSQILCNFLPLLREYLPEVASEIQSDMYSYINNGEAMMDDYVYDLYAVKDEMNTAEKEDDLDAYPLVQVGEEDDFYDGPQESEWDTSDSNAEDNPLNEYPDEESSEEETEEDEEEDEDDEDEEEDEEDEEGVTCVRGFRELDEFGKTKILHSSEEEYSYEDEDEDEDTLADDEDDDEDSWKWKHR